MTDWHIIRTNPLWEQVVRHRLHERICRVFLPLESRTIRHARRETERCYAYFPCYLFFNFIGFTERRDLIEATPGVAYILKSGDMLSRLPEGFIAELRKSFDEDDVLIPQPVVSPFAVGQTVRLQTGPFEDRIGRLHRLDGDGRATVLMQLMGSEVRVNIGISELSAVSK